MQPLCLIVLQTDCLLQEVPCWGYRGILRTLGGDRKKPRWEPNKWQGLRQECRWLYLSTSGQSCLDLFFSFFLMTKKKSVIFLQRLACIWEVLKLLLRIRKENVTRLFQLIPNRKTTLQTWSVWGTKKRELRQFLLENNLLLHLYFLIRCLLFSLLVYSYPL